MPTAYESLKIYDKGVCAQNVQNGERSRQNKSDDKQHKWLQNRVQDKRLEARRS